MDCYKAMRKGVSIPSTLIMTALIMLLLTFGVVYFAGGFLYYNHYPQNATLESDYNDIAVNVSRPVGGLFGPTSNLSQQTNTSVKNFGSLTFLTSLSSTLTTGYNVFTSALGIYYQLFNLIGTPFQAVGIPTGYPTTIAGIMMVVVIFIAILRIWTLVY